MPLLEKNLLWYYLRVELFYMVKVYSLDRKYIQAFFFTNLYLPKKTFI